MSHIILSKSTSWKSAWASLIQKDLRPSLLATRLLFSLPLPLLILESRSKWLSPLLRTCQKTTRTSSQSLLCWGSSAHHSSLRVTWKWPTFFVESSLTRVLIPVAGVMSIQIICSQKGNLEQLSQSQLNLGFSLPSQEEANCRQRGSKTWFMSLSFKLRMLPSLSWSWFLRWNSTSCLGWWITCTRDSWESGKVPPNGHLSWTWTFNPTTEESLLETTAKNFWTTQNSWATLSSSTTLLLPWNSSRPSNTFKRSSRLALETTCLKISKSTSKHFRSATWHCQYQSLPKPMLFSTTSASLSKSITLALDSTASNQLKPSIQSSAPTGQDTSEPRITPAMRNSCLTVSLTTTANTCKTE